MNDKDIKYQPSWGQPQHLSPQGPIDDSVNHPRHYNSHPSGVECITITEHMSFNVGNAIKYLWRAGLKTGPQKEQTVVSEQHLEDLEKAQWYINREIEKLRKENGTGNQGT